MKGSRRRLLIYVLGMVAILGGLEWLVRRNEALFAAASHRALAKAALLDRHGPVEVLFLGTSRFQDGVSPRAFSEETSKIRPSTELRAFNLAFTSSSLESLEYFARRYAKSPGLRLAVVELSEPQLKNETPPWEQSVAAPTQLEDALAQWVVRHLKLVAYRSALIGDNLLRLPGLLLFSAQLDGSEVLLVDQLRAGLGLPFSTYAETPLSLWERVGVREKRESASSARNPTADRQQSDARVERLAAIADQFRASDVVTLFVVPPLSRSDPEAMERGLEMKDFLGSLARSSGSAVWDFSDQSHPDALFRDTTHLNQLGRDQFSTALAAQVIASGLLEARLSKHP